MDETLGRQHEEEVLRAFDRVAGDFLAIKDKMPTSLIETVLPPVFGPEINKVLKLSPKDIETGTTLSLSIKGCLPSTILINPLVFIDGYIPLIFLEYAAFAKIISNSISVLYVSTIS